MGERRTSKGKARKGTTQGANATSTARPPRSAASGAKDAATSPDQPFGERMTRAQRREFNARVRRNVAIGRETIGNLARAIMGNSLPAADAASLCDGIFFPLLARLRDARGDEVGEAALRLAIGSVRVLLEPDKWDEGLVLRLDAIAHGFSRHDDDAAMIVELATMVERSAGFRRMNDPVRHRVMFDGREMTVGESAPAGFQAWFIHHHGAERAPTVEQIADWLDRHTTRRARGKLTTAGIVARIIEHGRLLGANVGGERAMLERVTKVLDRHR